MSVAAVGAPAVGAAAGAFAGMNNAGAFAAAPSALSCTFANNENNLCAVRGRCNNVGSIGAMNGGSMMAFNNIMTMIVMQQRFVERNKKQQHNVMRCNIMSYRRSFKLRTSVRMEVTRSTREVKVMMKNDNFCSMFMLGDHVR